MVVQIFYGGPKLLWWSKTFLVFQTFYSGPNIMVVQTFCVGTHFMVVQIVTFFMVVQILYSVHLL